VTLKAILAAAIAVAILAGVSLSVVLRHAEPKSQIEQIEVGRG
jgi:hypothetical protein